ncbi:MULTISPECIES: hemolysin family protein [Bacillus]|uniref:CBS domain containing-hemolysin-like protein n=1 Tax=Bacillus capparidis TaxID=1840411 RepID=A0ABS4D249_9BACI|nr:MULTISPECIES: hemolysin family protein [Bacillus]MBP1083663.1 CBS domain containing-hemolysin-like protein [Bacillus capparidis]MED1094855.1 hemolysin family protein [Bacillus capparidis]
MDDIDNLIYIGILIALTAFFVASEFAIVRVRGSKIDQLVTKGNKQAVLAKKITKDSDQYLSVCQLGITITALGLGWLGEPTFERLLRPLFGYMNLPDSLVSIITFGTAFGAITFLHVVIGELAPKTLAIQKSEKLTLWFSRPLHFFYIMMYPVILVLNGSARLLTGIFGLKMVSEHEAHSEEELKLILSESLKSGEINPSEYKFVNKIFEFDKQIAKDIMIPRTKLIAVKNDMSIIDVLKTVSHQKFTRYPVENGDKDHIIGMLNTKQLFIDLMFMSDDEVSRLSVKDYTRPVIEANEHIPLRELLKRMQRERIPMAILIDEYGGTAGLVTIEDILEEIVGDSSNEFNKNEELLTKKQTDDSFILDGTIESQPNFIEEEHNAIGGLMLNQRNSRSRVNLSRMNEQ